MPRSFKVKMKDGSDLTLTAERYETDGAGTRFYDAEGHGVSSFTDGLVAYVIPGDAVMTPPPAPAPDELPDEPPAPEEV